MKNGKFLRLIVTAAVIVSLAAAVPACGGDAGALKEGNNESKTEQSGDKIAPVVTKVSSDGNVDVYEMAFPDGSKAHFSVTNGENGEAGSSAYERYKEIYGYDGDEKQWLNALINGKLVGQKETYTVSFNSAGGGRVETQSVKNGEKALKPADPVRENYTFEGWFSGDEEWIFCGFPVTENVTLTAKWSENYTKGLKYTDLGYGYLVAGIGEATATKIVVPSEYDGYPVLGVESGAFKGNRTITRARLPGSIKTVGQAAFEDCGALAAVIFSEGLEKIEADAFKNCKKLAGLDFPDSVAEIGAGSFEGCEAVKNISFGKGVLSLGENAFNLGGRTAVNIGDVALWCRSQFNGENSQPFAFAEKLTVQDNLIKTLVIPEGVERISDGAFRNLHAAENLVLADSLEIIGESAFENCDMLAGVTFPDGTVSAGKRAFYGCGSLKTAVLGDKTEFLGEKCFSGCGNLTEITFGSAFGEFSYDIFSGDTAIEKINVSESNAVYYAQNDCLIASGGVLVLGGNFSSVPAGIKEIAPYAFAGAVRLSRAVLPEGLEKIGASAFAGCRNLVGISLPASLIAVEENAFADCRKLVEVINLSALGIKKYSSQFGGAGYYAKAVVSTPDDSRIMQDGEGYLFYSDAEETLLIGYEGEKTHAELPERFNGRTYAVYDSAFYASPVLQSVTVPGGVTAVGDYAFYGCTSLETAVISEGVESVGVGAFENCLKLTSVNLGKTRTVCKNAFAGCISLSEVIFASGLTGIGEKAFYGCLSLESVAFPKTLADVADKAFGECSGLKEVVFAGSGREWENVSLCPGCFDGAHENFAVRFTEN